MEIDFQLLWVHTKYNSWYLTIWEDIFSFVRDYQLSSKMTVPFLPAMNESPIALHPHQHLVMSVLGIWVILIDV